MIGFYENKNIGVKNTFEIGIELNLQDYLGHADQSKGNEVKTKDFLLHELKIHRYSKYFISIEDTCFLNERFSCYSVKNILQLGGI